MFQAIEERDSCNGPTYSQHPGCSDCRQPPSISNPINKGQDSTWRGILHILTAYLMTGDVPHLQGYIHFFCGERFTSIIAIYMYLCEVKLNKYGPFGTLWRIMLWDTLLLFQEKQMWENSVIWNIKDVIRKTRDIKDSEYTRQFLVLTMHYSYSSCSLRPYSWLLLGAVEGIKERCELLNIIITSKSEVTASHFRCTT